MKCVIGRIMCVSIFVLLNACSNAGPENTTTMQLEEPKIDVSRFNIAKPLSLESTLMLNDEQISNSIQGDMKDGIIFSNSQELEALTRSTFVAPYSPDLLEGTHRSLMQGPTLIPYADVGTYKRDWVESVDMPESRPFSGIMWVGGSFHVDGEDSHDVLVNVLLDYQQVDFTIGGHTSHAHVLRIPRDRVVIYDFELATVLSDGNHTISIVINWDPWNIYTSRAVKKVFSNPSRWHSAGPLLFDHVSVSNKYIRVGESKEPEIALQDILDSTAIPEGASSLDLSVSPTYQDPVRRLNQALALDGPQKLYAYVSYPPQSEESSQGDTLTVLVAFFDDKQVPIRGSKAFFWKAAEGKQYRIPIDIELPRDGKVHALNIFISFTPFLKPNFYDEARPAWLQADAFETTVVPVVPSHDWVPWLPKQ
jgi:hypothetical protein